MFKFRLSEEQKQLLNSKAKAVNMNGTQFLIKYIESSNINIKTNNKKDLKELIWNINKIGTNINQLSHGLNYSIQLEKLDSYNYENLINKLAIIKPIRFNPRKRVLNDS